MLFKYLQQAWLNPPLIAFFLLVAIWPFSANAINGIYLTLESGIATQQGLPNASQVGALRTDTGKFPSAYRTGIGYNHDLYHCLGIGLDVGLGYYGKKTYVYPVAKSDVRSETLEFLPFLQWHFQRWDIIGKIGGLRQTVIISGRDAQGNQTQIAAEVGIGLAYQVISHLSVIASYAHVWGDQMNRLDQVRHKNPSLNEGMIGIRYLFGG